MTDTKKMREQFEAWVLRNWPNQSLDRFSDGEYQGYTVQHCWIGWQASREAMVVELPARKGESTRGNGFNDALAECRAALEAQGLKVAP